MHIAAGDLLRAEIAAGSENARRAKEYMEKGQLVSDEIVVMVVQRVHLTYDHAVGDFLGAHHKQLLSRDMGLSQIFLFF